MRKIIKFECIKILTNKLFIYAFLGLILINIAVQIYSNKTLKQNEIPLEAYKKVNSELQNLSENEKEKLITKEYERNFAFGIINNIKNLSKSENEVMREYSNSLKEENIEIYNKYINEYENAKFEYTDDIAKEEEFWREIKEEFDSTKNYKNTITDILDKAENLETISIFKQSEDNFSNKNIKDTAQNYKKMLNTNISYQVSKGMTSFTKFGITDVVIILMLFVISSIIIFEEKEKNLFTIIKTTKNGRIKTICTKIITMLIAITAICTIMYLTNFIYYGITIGYGDLHASLQSVKPFIYSTLQISIGQYFILFVFTKILVFFIISLIILLISIFAKTNTAMYISFIGIFMISFLLYNNIDTGSKYNVLKYINIVNLLEVNDIYKSYMNLNVFGIMQDVHNLSNIVGAILLLGLSSTTMYVFNKKKDLTTSESVLWNKTKNIYNKKIGRIINQVISKMKVSTTIFANEFYKLFVTNKVAILLIIFIAFQIYNFTNTNKSTSYTENIYKSYMEVLSGKLTKEKEEFINKEKEKFEEANLQISNIAEKEQHGEITKLEAIRYKEPYEEILSLEPIFDKVLEQYEHIIENSNAEFIYDTGYKELLRVRKNSFLYSDIFLIISSIMCFTSIFIMEYKTGMINILRATPKGRKCTIRNKIYVCIFASIIIFVISIIPELLKVYQMYGFDNITASITSLICFNKLPVFIRVLDFIIIMYVFRFIVFICIVLFILWISTKIKNTTYCILVASSILLIPIILVISGLEFANIFSVTNVLNISRIIL